MYTKLVCSLLSPGQSESPCFANESCTQKPSQSMQCCWVEKILGVNVVLVFFQLALHIKTKHKRKINLIQQQHLFLNKNVSPLPCNCSSFLFRELPVCCKWTSSNRTPFLWWDNRKLASACSDLQVSLAKLYKTLQELTFWRLNSQQVQ